MDLAKWLSDFRTLHQKARAKQLSKEEWEIYVGARTELARAMLSVQKTNLQSGQTPREALRATRAFPIELEIDGRMRPHMTMNISSGGFAAILAEAPKGPINFSLKLPGESEPIKGEASCVQANPHPGSCHCCFRYETIGRDDRERIEMLVFDLVLEHIHT
jgi:hypothetical protein